MPLQLPYVPGSLPMPSYPSGYVPPIPVERDQSVRPDGDVERHKGGPVYCETYQNRDQIPPLYRCEGTTIVYVKQPSGPYPGDTFWYLRGGITNDCWTPREFAAMGRLPGQDNAELPASTSPAQLMARVQVLEQLMSPEPYAFDNTTSLTIDHNLGRRVNPSLFDANGLPVKGMIISSTLNSITITFSQPLSGTAVLL